MARARMVLVLVALLVPASAGPEPQKKPQKPAQAAVEKKPEAKTKAKPGAKAKPKPKKVRLRYRLKNGARYNGSNTVSYSVKTSVREGERVESSSESVQRTERYIDKVARAGENGVLEIRRNYLQVYTKVRDSEKGRPTIHQSPMQGSSATLLENRRRRDLKLDEESEGVMDTMVRRIAGMELDWRDVFPDEPVGPGDRWDGDATALSRRLAAYLNTGTRARMRVRYEENVVRDGSRQAKLYVDWTVEGMRDRHLFTKVDLAGDIYYDFKTRRVMDVDLAGSMIVRGAIVGKRHPRIIKGHGPVSVVSTLRLAEPQAAVDDK